MKNTIVFIDDEQRVLDGFRRSYHALHDIWEMHFFVDPEEAIRFMNRHATDVVVTDMRMPKLEGSEVLKVVSQSHPRICRFILSGYSDLEAAMRVVPIAHEYLTKPSAPGFLQNRVERSMNIRFCFDEIEKSEAFMKNLRFPTRPRLYAELVKVLSNLDATFRDVAGVIAADEIITSKLLRMVNSAFFGVRVRIEDVMGALSYLGINIVKNLVLSIEVFQMMRVSSEFTGFSVLDLQNHSFQCASIARRLLPDKKASEDAFTAALLHDLGKLMLAHHIPSKYNEIFSKADFLSLPVCAVEQEMLGFTHADLGAYLLNTWGLTYPIIEAVLFHHDPDSVPHGRLEIVDAVHVANSLSKYVDRKLVPEIDRLGLNENYLQSIGAHRLFREWQNVCRDMISQKGV